MRILVCGGRKYSDKERVREVLAEYHCIGLGDTLIHGGSGRARDRDRPTEGADKLAAEVAEELGWQIEEYKANWLRFGTAAGPIRNRAMIDRGKPDVVIAFPGGRGTEDMVARAEKAGIPVRRIT